MLIKVMIVDDETQIRKILKTVIERNSAFKVECECDNMTDALILYNQHKPDVIFMDIEINGSSGIDCAKVITDMNTRTKIIFATAHSEYMSNAFEMYAFDYLVKPFDTGRIEHTLSRLLEFYPEAVKPNESNIIERQEHVIQHKSVIELKDKLAVKGKESINFIDIKDIVFIERNNSMTVIYTESGEEIITSMALNEIQEKLNAKIFMRCHKSYIINISKIKSIEPYGRWTFTVKFKGIKADALLTKEKYDIIRELFK